MCSMGGRLAHGMNRAEQSIDDRDGRSTSRAL
jgi:hypothetical protein